MSLFDSPLDRLERIGFQQDLRTRMQLETPEQEIARLAREDEERRRSALFDGIPLHTDGPRIATLIVENNHSRCSACRGNADPNERTHLHGGPVDGDGIMPGLDEERGCGAVFVDVDDRTCRNYPIAGLARGGDL